MDEKLRDEILSYLSGYRLRHTLGSEKMAIKLAEHWGGDKELCALSALLHDITKKFSTDEQLKLCEKHGIIVDGVEKREPKLLHGKTAALIAREKFHVNDTVYNAVYYHTTGRANMSLAEKILYLADYSEENRDFDGVEKIRELAFSDIDKALVHCFETSLKDLIERKKLIHKDSVEALNYLYEHNAHKD